MQSISVYFGDNPEILNKLDGLCDFENIHSRSMMIMELIERAHKKICAGLTIKRKGPKNVSRKSSHKHG